MAFNNEIEEVKAQIKVLEKKLSFLEELSQTKSPVEEAYKDWWGEYPKSIFNSDDVRWLGFQAGYNAAYEEKVAENLLPDDHPYKIADEHGETNPYLQYLNSVEDEKKMEELGFVKNSDGNWTAQPLVETAQEPEEEPEENEWKSVALRFGEKLSGYLSDGYYELSPAAWFRWAVFTYGKGQQIKDAVRESKKWCEENPEKSVEDYLSAPYK